MIKLYQVKNSPSAATLQGTPVNAFAAKNMVEWLLETVLVWQDRANQRRQLAGLDPRLLADVGLTPDAVQLEISKPFWRT